MNQILWSKKAKRQLSKIPLKFRVAITDATRKLSDFPDCSNVKALQKHDVGYRLRVGRYRVLFDYDGEIKIIAIQEVKKRDEHTY